MAARPTLREVALEAGVSTCTVSKALRDGAGVAEKTVERVRLAAESIGYVPNDAARTLVSRRSRTLGLLVSNASNRYFGTLLGAANAVAQQQGFNIVSGDSLDSDGVPNPRQERSFTRSLVQQRVAGVIVMGPVSEAALADFARGDIPVVFVDAEPPARHAAAPAVLTDNRVGGRMVGEHLRALGARRCVVVAHPPAWTSREGRVEGFREGVGPEAAVAVVEGGYNSEDARAAVAAHLASTERAPDALFATNEALLFGALEALDAAGLRAGDDVRVVGFDEFDWASRLDPPLTTVDQHVHRLGTEAAELLLELLDGEPATGHARRTIEPTLLVRASSGS
jgi:LacI family transcriptional regulator